MGKKVKPRALYKQPRSECWHYAISVPPEFRHLFDNKKELRKSTGERDHSAAMRLYLHELLLFDAKCQTDSWDGQEWQLLTPELGPTIISTVCIKLRQEFETQWRAGAYIGKDEWGGDKSAKLLMFGWRDDLERLIADLGDNFINYWMAVRQPVKQYTGIRLAEDVNQDPLLLDFCIDFADKVLAQLEYILSRIEGKRAAPPPLESEAPQARLIQSKPVATGTGTIWDAFEKWKTERTTNQKSIDARAKQLEVFVGYCGLKPIAEYTQEEAGNFKTAMLVGDIKPTGKQLSALTISNYLVGIKAIFNIAQEYRILVGDSPFKYISNPSETNKARIKVSTALTVEQLRTMFAAGKPFADLKEPSHVLPLLALYTGARLQELAQLCKSDFHFKYDRYWISISEDDDEGEGESVKSVKSESSIRDVPLHQAIVDTGLMEWIKTKAPATGNVWGFTPNKYGRVGQAISKYWTRHCTDAGVPGRFHRFRHTFKHYSRDSKMDRVTSERILGHSDAEKEDLNYAKGTQYPAHLLLEGIDKYTVKDGTSGEALDVSHIKVQF